MVGVKFTEETPRSSKQQSKSFFSNYLGKSFRLQSLALRMQ
jgi:hypothetical protein